MSAATFDHPATFTPAVLVAIERVLMGEVRRRNERLRVVDPFAGTGGIHDLDGDLISTCGFELEPEWADVDLRTNRGDATALPASLADTFDAVATSPAYGNRMADQYDGRDGSKRRTYRLSLGRPMTDGNGAAMQWGPEYRDLHGRAMDEMVRVVRPDGLVIVNMRNHIRAGREQMVVEWWTVELLARGCRMVEVQRIATPGFGFGQNGQARVDGEHLIVVRASGVSCG